MNTGILKKCLDELSKESPRLDYVRGMLETLIEMQEKPILLTGLPEYKPIFPDTPNRPLYNAAAPASDEASILEAKARAGMDILKNVKPGSVETE